MSPTILQQQKKKTVNESFIKVLIIRIWLLWLLLLLLVVVFFFESFCVHSYLGLSVNCVRQERSHARCCCVIQLPLLFDHKCANLFINIAKEKESESGSFYFRNCVGGQSCLVIVATGKCDICHLLPYSLFACCVGGRAIKFKQKKSFLFLSYETRLSDMFMFMLWNRRLMISTREYLEEPRKWRLLKSEMNR